MPNNIRCPACGQPQADRGETAVYYCQKCGGMFDGEPDEGGSYGNRPDARLEREERQREQRKERLKRRA